jgi:ABC-2 type transport system ATP-binding protein
MNGYLHYFFVRGEAESVFWIKYAVTKEQIQWNLQWIETLIPGNSPQLTEEIVSHFLEVQELVKTFGQFSAVDGITFHIEEGEIFSLLGPNGAGKTTTISMISTLIPPTSGDVFFAGNSVTRDPMATRRGLGIVPQELAIYDELTARENLSFWGQMYGLSGRSLKERMDEVLAQIDLVDKANQRARTYSGGMKRRLNIGVGLLHKPRLLIMDEPTVGIDPQSRRAILDSVKELNRQGMTVLYTTHYMEEAQELSDRVGIIDHGKLIAMGTQQELTRQVGETSTVTLNFSEGDSLSRVPDLLQALRQISGVTAVKSDDHSVSVIAPEAEKILAPAITTTSAFGLRIRSVNIQEPDLETVFLSLTGRALRD